MSGGFHGLSFLSKMPMLGVSQAVLQGPLCLLSYTSMVLSEGHIWLKYTSVFCLVSTKLAKAVFVKIELRHKKKTSGFS